MFYYLNLKEILKKKKNALFIIKNGSFFRKCTCYLTK